MFKNKPFLLEQTDAVDKLLFNKIKKFNSERNLFFSNIYNNNDSVVADKYIINGNGTIKSDRTFSYKNGLLKKFKSLKDIYHHNGGECNGSVGGDSEFASRQLSITHFDDFERNYLFLNGKKDLVKKLRKNFENEQTNNHKAIPVLGNEKNCEFSYSTKRFSFNGKQNNEFLSRRTPERKSFYRTINGHCRNEADATQHSVLSVSERNNLNNCHVIKNKSYDEKYPEIIYQNELYDNGENCHKNETIFKETGGWIRKCGSDLNLLKSELDNLIDLKWKALDTAQNKVCIFN